MLTKSKNLIKAALFFSVGWHLFCMSFFSLTFSTLKNDSDISIDFLGSILRDRDVITKQTSFKEQRLMADNSVLLYEQKPNIALFNAEPSKPLFTKKAVYSKISSSLIDVLGEKERQINEPELQKIPDWKQEKFKLKIEEP